MLQSSNILYFAFNLGCGFAKNGPQIYICRFFAGFGGSAMIALGGGILSDLFIAVSSLSSVTTSFLINSSVGRTRPSHGSLYARAPPRTGSR